MATDPSSGLCILGLGNVLCGDDGLGVVAIEGIRKRYRFGPEVAVLDGGTLGLALLTYVADASALILVDAVDGEGGPGALVELDGESVSLAAAERLSVHQVGVVDLLDALRLTGRYPPSLHLLGIVPGDIGLGVGLTPAVEARLPELMERVALRARSLGFPYTEASHVEDPPVRPVGPHVVAGL